jgi:hypothetical protein
MRHTLLFVIVVAFCGSTSVAQDSVTIASDPKDLSRPVSTLLNQLRKREKISVTYEDPRYSNNSDIEDVTTEVAKNLSEAEKKYGQRILIPKGHPATFVYSPQDVRTPDGAEKTIARMLSEYEALGGPNFIVMRDGIRLHVVPGEVVNARGGQARRDSILDTLISIVPAERDGAQLLQEICDQIKKQTGYTIDIGPGALNMRDSRRRQGVDSQTARAALEQVWDGMSVPGSFVWDLYYDPSDKSYGLSFSYVGPAGPGLNSRAGPNTFSALQSRALAPPPPLPAE